MGDHFLLLVNNYDSRIRKIAYFPRIPKVYDFYVLFFAKSDIISYFHLFQRFLRTFPRKKGYNKLFPFIRKVYDFYVLLFEIRDIISYFQLTAGDHGLHLKFIVY